MKMKKKSEFLAVILLLAFSLAACGGGGGGGNPNSGANTNQSPGVSNPAGSTQTAGGLQPTEGKQYGGVLKTVGDTQTPFGLPWVAGLSNAATVLLVPWGESLTLEATSGDVYPWLAKSWEIDQEREEIVMQLRDDVYFIDGSKFNADVVVWNMDKSKEARALNPAIDRFEKRGEYEVAVIMAGGYANHILNLLASKAFAMCSMENYILNGEDFAAQNPVGTGPFVLAEKTPGSRMVYERNEAYWQEGKPFLDGIEYYAMSDAMTQNAAMLAKGTPDALDVLSTMNGEQIALLRDDPDLTAYAFQNGNAALFPDSRNPDSPFSKLEVRQALSYAINREDIVAARGFGVFTASRQFLAKDTYGYFDDDRDLFGYDPDKARSLLADAGYPNGFATTFYVPGGIDRDAMIAVQHMLGEVGIVGNLEFPESGAATELRTGGWDGLYAWILTSLASTPSTFRLHFDPEFVYYPVMWRPVEEMAADYQLCRTTKTFEDPIFRRLHQVLADHMVLVPVYDTYNTYIVRNSIRDGEHAMWALGTQWLPSEVWRAAE